MWAPNVVRLSRKWIATHDDDHDPYRDRQAEQHALAEPLVGALETDDRLPLGDRQREPAENRQPAKGDDESGQAQRRRRATRSWRRPARRRRYRPARRARRCRSPLSAIIATHPVSATSEPTERSMPAVMMIKVIPEAIMALIETCRATFVRLGTVRKPGTNTAITTNEQKQRRRAAPDALSWASDRDVFDGCAGNRRRCRYPDRPPAPRSLAGGECDELLLARCLRHRPHPRTGLCASRRCGR